MPAGYIHIKWYKSVLFPYSIGVTIYAYDNFILWSGLILGYLLGLVIDPDLDLIGLSSAEGRVLKKLGILAWGWLAWWLGYSLLCLLFGGHRSLFSHSLLLSTIFRLGWFVLGSYLLLYGFGVRNFSFLPTMYLIYLFIGLALADSIHILLDKTH